MTIEVEVSARRDGELRCVFCRGELTGAVETCPGCGVTCHPACRAEMSRCATIGCSGVRGEDGAAPRRRRPSRLVAERPRDRDVVPPTPAPAVVEPTPEDDRPDLRRARTPAQLLAWSAVGASIGGLLGLAAAYMVSRHGIEGQLAAQGCSIGLVVGAAEGALVGKVGVRRDPLFPSNGERHPTSALLSLLLSMFAGVGGVVADQLHGPVHLGALAGFLLALPWLLRWLGFG